MKLGPFELNFKVKISQLNCKIKKKDKNVYCAVKLVTESSTGVWGLLVRVWREEAVCGTSGNLEAMNNSPTGG
jgi:hypothetical protein